MAKNIKCPFCGKEIVSGWFSGTAVCIEIGEIVSCCEECGEKYKPIIKEHGERFSTKFGNLKKATKRKFTEKEVADMFVKYLNEEKEYSDRTGFMNANSHKHFYTYDSNFPNYFSVREFGKGFLNSDNLASNMVLSKIKTFESLCYHFDRNDITKIEYAQIGSGAVASGDNQQMFSYAIRLNDESVMTYKPCITRFAVLSSNSIFGRKKSAEKELIRILTEFKNQIGSDLPIVKVSKI